MKKAGINYANKHHGPHALRHSLATNMINNNVPQVTELVYTLNADGFDLDPEIITEDECVDALYELLKK